MAIFNLSEDGKGGGTQLLIDGEFECSYHPGEQRVIPEQLKQFVYDLMNVAFEAGRDNKAKEIRKVIGA
jgi:hypothetical protein